MSPLNITIISLVIIGVLACIIALIWTKIIKPNTFGYSNKNMLTKHWYNDLLKKIETKTKIKKFDNVKFNFDNHKMIVIEEMFFTSQGVYFISNPLEEKVIDIKKIDNNIKLIYKNNKMLDLPLDVSFLLDNIKKFKKHCNLNCYKFIVPVSNNFFTTKQIDNIDFVQKEDVESFIIDNENKSSSFNANDFEEQINKYIIKIKKRSFLKTKHS